MWSRDITQSSLIFSSNTKIEISEICKFTGVRNVIHFFDRIPQVSSSRVEWLDSPATARPIGQARHCPTIFWHLILMSYVSILLFRLSSSVSHNNCRSTISNWEFPAENCPLMLLGQMVYRNRCKRIQDRVRLQGTWLFWGMLPPLFLWTVSSLY